MSSIDTPGEGIRFREGIPTVLFVVSVSAVFFIGRSAFSPLLMDIEAAFSVSHAASSRLMVVFTLGYGITMFFSGIVSRLITHRRLIPISALLGAVGMTILAVAPGMGAMRLGLVVFGMGFGLYVPTGINMITTVVRREDWQKALSINELSPHFGMIVAPLIVAALRPILPWRAHFAIVAVVFLCAAVLFMRRVREGDRYGQAPTWTALSSLAARPAFWLLIAFFALALSGTDGVYLLIPTFLVTEGGVDPRLANAVFGLSRFMPVISLSLAAVVFDRFGPRYTVTFALVGQGVAILLLGATAGWARLALVFIQPAIGALYFPAGFAALSSLMPPATRNVGISMALPLSVFLGVGVLPAIVGYLGDHASFALGFILLGTVMTACGMLALFFRFYEDE